MESGHGSVQLEARPKKTSARDWLFAGPFLAACFALVVATSPDIGRTIDEGPYRDNAQHNVAWFGVFVKNPSWALNHIDDYWHPYDLHPPLVKVVIGTADAWFEGLMGPIDAPRLSGAFFFVVMLGVVYFWMAREYGREAGVFAALFLLLCPRIFGDAHIAALDIPMAATSVLAAWAFMSGLKSPLRAVLFGVALGLALLTKLNAFFLPAPLFIWGLVFRTKPTLRTLAIGLPVAVVVFFIGWPWLWLDPFVRAKTYFMWHAKHTFIEVYYFGKSYKDPPAPWHYPFVMTAITVPISMLIALGAGIGRAFYEVDKKPLGMLLLLSALVPMIVLALPFSPVYDGVRLFMPAFPFMACLAGIGFALLLRAALRLVPAIKKKAALRLGAPIVLGLVFAVPPAIRLAQVHPYYLSYYNALIGGISGAHRAGMEPTYWGDACNRQVIEYLNQNARPNATVFYMWLGDAPEIYASKNYRILRGDITLLADLPVRDNAWQAPDYVLVSCRLGMFDRLTWDFYNQRNPYYHWKKVFEKDGVPLVIILERNDDAPRSIKIK